MRTTRLLTVRASKWTRLNMSGGVPGWWGSMHSSGNGDMRPQPGQNDWWTYPSDHDSLPNMYWTSLYRPTPRPPPPPPDISIGSPAASDIWWHRWWLVQICSLENPSPLLPSLPVPPLLISGGWGTYGWQAGSTHFTGMPSCSVSSYSST